MSAAFCAEDRECIIGMPGIVGMPGMDGRAGMVIDGMDGMLQEAPALVLVQLQALMAPLVMVLWLTVMEDQDSADTKGMAITAAMEARTGRRSAVRIRSMGEHRR